MGKLQNAIDQRRKRIAELRADLPRVSERMAKAIQGTIDELGNQIFDIERSHEYASEKETEHQAAFFHARFQHNQGLEQRRSARQDAIRAEREQYDGLIEAFDWTLAPQLATLDARRAVAREHAAKVAARNDEMKLLLDGLKDNNVLTKLAAESNVPLDVMRRIITKEIEQLGEQRLESIAHDIAGRGYLIVTDDQGTWAERAITADASEGDGTGGE